MATNYFNITADTDLRVAEMIYNRQREIAEYDANDAVLSSILATFSDLPDVWPGSLEKYKGGDSLALASATDLSAADRELVNRMQHRDITQRDLNMTRQERAKAAAIMEGQAKSMTPERLTAAIAAFTAKLATAQ